MCENAFMRTTIDLPDELFRQIKIRAARDGVKLKELITRYLEQGLNGASSPSTRTKTQRSKLPVVRLKTNKRQLAFTNADLFDLLQGKGQERGRDHER